VQGEGKSVKVLGFNASERAGFLKLVSMFGLGDGTWRHFIRVKGALKRKSYDEIITYGNQFLAHLLEPKDRSSNPNTYANGVPKDPSLKRKDLLTRIAKLHLIEGKIRSTESLAVPP
jgi:chromodomain-helicase-DNA-binding protein 4